MSESALSDIETLIDRLSIEDDWECFVWYSITEVYQTHTISQHWLRVFKNGLQNLVWYPDSQRWYTKQMKERFVWYQDKIKSETRISSGSVSSNIRPPVEIHINKTRVGVFQLISRQKEVFRKSCDSFFQSISMFRNIGWNTSFIAGAFWYNSSNNQLYSSFRESHSSKFEKCCDDQYSISLFRLYVLLTSFRDAT